MLIVLGLLQELPEQWNNTKKLSFQVKQNVAPLQANEVSIIRRKCQQFEVPRALCSLGFLPAPEWEQSQGMQRMRFGSSPPRPRPWPWPWARRRTRRLHLQCSSGTETAMR